MSLTYRKSFDRGDSSRDSEVTLDVHCGTHIESSAHVRASGDPLGSGDLDRLMGKVAVLDAAGLNEVPRDLVATVPAGVVGVLVRTDNSVRRLMEAPDFEPNFVGWSTGFAEAIASMSDVRIAGSDYLSIQPFGGDPRVHTCLLDAGITIVEGLNLANVQAGLYEMFGLALLMPSREASPARVLLRPITAP